MKKTEKARAGPSLTADKFLGDRLTICQPAIGYRAGIDAVMLAASVESGPGGPKTLLDIGAGVGTIGLCTAARIPDLSVTLFEREPALVTIAEDNIAANGFETRAHAVLGDVGMSAGALLAAGLAPESFDIVLANPPYHDEAAGTRSRVALKDGAHAMPQEALDDWVRFMARMVKPGGRASLIHKAEALPRILETFEPRFGAIVVYPIFPRAGEDAIRVIVSGVKGSRAPLVVRSGFVLHGPGQDYTPDAGAILRGGSQLDF